MKIEIPDKYVSVLAKKYEFETFGEKQTEADFVSDRIKEYISSLINQQNTINAQESLSIERIEL